MEVWRTIPNWPRYEVSDQGRVRRGTKLLRGWAQDGYVYMHLFDQDRDARVRLPGLVLQAFVGPRPSGMEARHLNDNKADNTLANLRWGTSVENYEDAVRNGLTGYGENNPRSRLTQAAVDDIRAKMKLPLEQRRALKITVRSLATHYGVTKNAVHQVLTGKTWTRT